MQNFINAECPYCGKKFTANDDIVVCPECGTPHHRECYKAHNKCANDELHGSFEWGASPAAGSPKAEEPTGPSDRSVICPNCGAVNPGEPHYCVNCGAPIGNTQGMPNYSAEEAFRRERERAFAAAFDGADFDGVSPKEAALVVRSNIEYFLVRFKAFAAGRKADTNFSAFLFSFFYLFYRKMYGLGIAVFAANMILSIPAMLLDLMTIQNMYVEQGILSQIIWNVPHQSELTVFAFIASIIIWVIRVALMFFCNRLYYSKVVSTVKKARETAAGENALFDSLHRKGGTSMVFPIVIFALSMLLSFGIAAWLMSSPYFILF